MNYAETMDNLCEYMKHNDETIQHLVKYTNLSDIMILVYNCL